MKVVEVEVRVVALTGRRRRRWGMTRWRRPWVAAHRAAAAVEALEPVVVVVALAAVNGGNGGSLASATG